MELNEESTNASMKENPGMSEVNNIAEDNASSTDEAENTDRESETAAYIKTMVNEKMKGMMEAILLPKKATSSDRDSFWEQLKARGLARYEYYRSKYPSLLCDMLGDSNPGRSFDDPDKYRDEALNLFRNIYNKYRDSYPDLYEKAIDDTFRIEYSSHSKGNSMSPLDHYCPLHDDLHVGGAKRGKIIKKKKSGTPFESEYRFNGEGDLICVRTHYEPETDDKSFDVIVFPVYENRTVTVLSYEWPKNGSSRLRGIMVFTYDDNCRMVLAEKADTTLFDYHKQKDIGTIGIELNAYDEAGMLKTMITRTLLPPGGPFGFTTSVSIPSVYKMIRDKDGNLSTYEVGGRSYKIQVKGIKDVPQLPNLDKLILKEPKE